MSTQHLHGSETLPPPRLEEVTPGIYAYVQADGSWFLNNAGFIVADEYVVSIDTTGTENRGRAYHAALRSVTDKPVQTLINTHAHADHTHGNFMFAPASAIIAHERCRIEVKRSNVEALRPRFPGADFGNPPVTPPTVTFTDRMKVYAGDLEIQLIHLGPAHTNNDVIAWIPERRVIFTGDLVFNGGTPFAMAGSVWGWLEALPFLRELNAEQIIPGHGDVCTPAAFDTVQAYLEFIAALAIRGHADRVDPLELALATDLGDFAGLTDPERIVGNLVRCYAELDGTPRGGGIDVGKAFSGMVAYNGGQPLRCLA